LSSDTNCREIIHDGNFGDEAEPGRSNEEVWKKWEEWLLRPEEDL